MTDPAEKQTYKHPWFDGEIRDRVDRAAELAREGWHPIDAPAPQAAPEDDPGNTPPEDDQ